MKNPIRAWVAKVAREEIYEERRERNLQAVKDEVRVSWGRVQSRNRAATEHEAKDIKRHMEGQA